MEEDRLETNLGTSTELAQDAPPVARTPRRRFVGSRAVAKTNGQHQMNSIEDAGAIQGKFSY